MTPDTPVERRLREMAQRLGGSWSPTETRHAAAIDRGREAIALLREWLSEDMGDLGLRAHKRRARALLIRCEQDGLK